MKRLYYPKHLALLAILSCLTISACSVTSPSSITPSAESSSQVTPSSDTSSQEPPASTSQEPITSSSQEVSSSSESSSSEASSSSSEESSSESSSSSSSQKKTYTVTWKNGDSVLETDLTVEEGSMPSYDGATPTKEKDAQYFYSFAGWDKELSPVEGNITYTATFNENLRSYTVTFVSNGGSNVVSQNINYGNKVAKPSNPNKEGYSFVNWYKEYAFTNLWDFDTDVVTSDVTLYAKWNINQYTITFNTNGGSSISPTTQDYGTVIEAPSNPTKEGYTFSGWDTDIPATMPANNLTINAIYTINKYTVTWKNYDGTTLETDSNVEYGTTPTFNSSTPTREGNTQYSYSFAGWDKELSPVEGNITYTATFNQSVNTYVVTWNIEGNKTNENYNYGDMPSFKGSTPTKEGNAQYTYVFDGWTPALAPVNSDVTYTAKFSSSTNAYEITWKDYDDSVIDKTNVEYGSAPSHAGPKRADDDSYTYTFKAWDPTPVAVTGEATYKATYTATAKPVVTTFPDTIYFTNNKGWSTVKAHCWGGTGTATTWPGKSMTFFKVNGSSQDVYSISGMSKYENVIFTDGSNQTVDIAAKDLGKGQNAYYCLDTKDSKGHYKVGQWYESGEASYSFKTKGQNILHCFDWKISTIMNNLDAIASQGFNAIQISPIQPVKDYSDSYDDTHETWWRFYQPIGLCIANQTTNILFSTDDGAAELTALCEAAAKKGIRIIADVIINHLADGTGDGGLHPSVKDFCPEIYNDYTNTLHNPYGKVDVNYSTIAGIVRSDAFGKDLKTSNSKVQTSVYNFLKSLVDCGVTGFRFDAAKHVETAKEGGGCASNFWEKTLGLIVSYASTQYKRTIWSYGEIINPGDAGRSYYQYINDAWFYAVTSQPGWYDLPANNCVYWGESHDDYMGDAHHTTGVSQADINSGYAYLAQNNKDMNVLYFVRPVLTDKIIDGGVGYHADWGWQNGDVKSANKR